ncbi:MAG: CRISPR-associated protein Cas5, partial [Polyangiaceae bacterium]|nr:CRISPR-associated protein Cas5 [Polyangiaceae bacterium]
MARLWLHARAPFAAYRGMQAGVYRTTAPTIPYSAALGLVLNLAGIETRDSTPGATTLVRSDVPRLRIAIGERTAATVSTIYQQLHSYPVGNSGKEFQERTHGAKYWIAPVRREILVSLDVLIGVEADDDLTSRVRR